MQQERRLPVYWPFSNESDWDAYTAMKLVGERIVEEARSQYLKAWAERDEEDDE